MTGLNIGQGERGGGKCKRAQRERQREVWEMQTETGQESCR